MAGHIVDEAQIAAEEEVQGRSHFRLRQQPLLALRF